MNKILSFPFEAVSPEAKGVFSEMGSKWPMMALTGVDVSTFRRDLPEAHFPFYEELSAELAEIFNDICLGALARLSGDRPVRLIEDFHNNGDVTRLPTDNDDIKTMLVGREHYQDVETDKPKMHLDTPMPHSVASVYGMHLTTKGGGSVFAAHSNPLSNGYYFGYRKEDILTREAQQGDLHIFMRQSHVGESDDLSRPTYHGFQTDPDEERHHIQASYGLGRDWASV